MPFTFAHPLYAAPLKLLKPSYISLTGIILGSMSPDYEYFMTLEPYQTMGHTLKGLILEAIPLSIIFAYLFHYIIKTPLALHMPGWFRLDQKCLKLIRPWSLNSVRKWIIFIISVVIGFASHVLLDAFTHKSGAFVMKYPWLNDTIRSIPIYKFLQHSLSLLGLVVQCIILVVILNHQKLRDDERCIVSKTDKLKYWVIVMTVAIVTIGLKFILLSSTNYIGMMVVSLCSGLMLGITISSMFAKEKSTYDY